MLNRFRRLPLGLRVALAATIGAFLLNVQWALSQVGWKMDQGFATPVDAIVGFALVRYPYRGGDR
jgi:hypothetical protein